MSLIERAKSAAAEVTRLAMQRVRSDSFVNALTGLGTARDKRSAATYSADYLLTMQELDNLFSSNDLVSTIVTKLVDDALREGFDVKRSTPNAEKADLSKDQELAEAILARCQELNVRERVSDAATWGRLFGGGGIILGVQGGGSLTSELDDSKVRGVAFLTDVDRQDLVPMTWTYNGEPQTYTWTPVLPGTASLGNVQIHASRVITFPGAKTTKRARARNLGWDHSIIQRVYNAIKGVDGMWNSVEAMFQDMSQAVFKLQGFIAAMAEADGQGAQAIETRIQLMDTLRSVSRAIVLDGGDETGQGAESFEVVERGALTGTGDVLDKSFLRLACAARMPVTVLMGQSPAGMDATGDSDLEIWYNEVQCFRRHVIEPRLARIVHLIARELGDKDPELWCIEWPTLEQADAKEEAEIEQIKVTTAIAVVTAQGATPEELALSLKTIAPKLGLEIDEEAREIALEAVIEQIKNPPEPPAPGTVADPNATPPAPGATPPATPAKPDEKKPEPPQAA
jgi:phage-related protein (TIGR01555 family)